MSNPLQDKTIPTTQIPNKFIVKQDDQNEITYPALDDLAFKEF